MSIARSVGVAALALMLAAGAAVAVETSALSTYRAGGVSTILLSGQSVHATANPVINQRLIPIARSSKLVATWDEVLLSGKLEHYYALSLDGRTFAQVQRTAYQVRLAAISFDPREGEPVIPDALKADANCRTYLVQFVMPPIDEFRRDIANLGGAVEAFLTDHTHIITMDDAAAAKVAALPYVRWVGKYHPAYRVESSVRNELLSTTRENGARRYSIQCHRRGMAQQQAVGDAIKKVGGILEVFTPDQFRMEATLTRAQLMKLVAMNEVCYVDPWGGPGGTDMMVVRQLQGAIPTLSNLGITGQGVRGEVYDSEVRITHEAFQNPPVLIHGGSTGTPLNPHGSSCYGIIFAKWPSVPSFNGMVTDAEQGIFNDFLLSTQFGGATSRLTFNTQAVNPAGIYRSSFQSSSAGSDPVTVYTTISAETDDYLFQVDYLSFQSQSNTGNQTSRPQAWSKNIISVGGVGWLGTLSRTDDAYQSASFGPASDNRIKPDLTNCYDFIPTTSNAADNATTTFGGTSGATPITAGDGGLLLQMWHQGIFPGFGGGSSVLADRPRSTTAKALMVNTAYRYPLFQAGLTRARQGWGMPDLTNLYTLRNKMFIVNETEVLQNAQTKFYPFTVAPGEPNIGFTMVYSDPAGSPAAAQARINDLSIRLTDPNGVMYWGNGGLTDNNWSTPGGEPDTINTVENIFIQNPVAGPWTLEVVGSSIVQDAHPQTPAVTDATYALVASGPIVAPATPLFFQFAGNAPTLIPPGAPYDVFVRIIPGAQAVVPGTPAMFYRTSGAGPFSSVALVALGGDAYRGTLPPVVCGANPQFYFTAQPSSGPAASFPGTAPAAWFSSPVGAVTTSTVLQVDFDTDLPPGWTASGLWHVGGNCFPTGTPCAGNSAVYYGQDSTCTYNTGGVGNSGVLASPQITLPTVPPGGAMTLSFCSALLTEGNPVFDVPEVLINGARVAVALESASWTTQSVDISGYSGQTITLAFHFDATDEIDNNHRGWHMDNIKIVSSVSGCSNPCYANCDNSTAAPVLSVNDFLCFLNKFAAGDSYANCDNSTFPPVLNVNDFLCFLNKFAAGCS